MSSATPDEGTQDVQDGADASVPATEASANGIQARFAGRTAVGLVREHNEDNFVIVDLTAGERCPRDVVEERPVGDRGMLFSVCDGMGGAAAGEVASQMAVDILFEAMTRDPAPTERDDLARRLVSAIEEAGSKIHSTAQAERDRRGMGTTSTAAALLDKVLFVGEVGDSRAYLLRKGAMKQITKDQSLVSQLIEAGHLTEDEAEAFEHSNIILQALGTSESVQVDLTFVELRRGDRLMVCSDGLSGLVHDDSICEALGDIEDPSECASTLIEYAEAGGGHDNITVIVADFDGEGLPEATDSDSFGYMQYPLLPEGADGAAPADGDEGGGGADRAATPAVAATATADGDDDVDLGKGSEGGRGWLIAGVIALLVGGFVLAQSGGGEPSESGGEAAVPEPEPAPEEAPVLVSVHTDVEDATLLVNGEAHGRLLPGSVKELKLRPGAYRFEAQSGGAAVAVELKSIQPNVPLEVHLDLPEGQEDPQGGQDAPAPEEPEEVQQEAQEAPAEEPAPAVEAAPAPAPKPAPKQRKKRAAPKPKAPTTTTAPAPTPTPTPKPKPKPKPKAPADGPAIPDNPF